MGLLALHQDLRWVHSPISTANHDHPPHFHCLSLVHHQRAQRDHGADHLDTARDERLAGLLAHDLPIHRISGADHDLRVLCVVLRVDRSNVVI